MFHLIVLGKNKTLHTCRFGRQKCIGFQLHRQFGSALPSMTMIYPIYFRSQSETNLVSNYMFHSDWRHSHLFKHGTSLPDIYIFVRMLGFIFRNVAGASPAYLSPRLILFTQAAFCIRSLFKWLLKLLFNTFCFVWIRIKWQRRVYSHFCKRKERNRLRLNIFIKRPRKSDTLLQIS